jgi:HD-like signal output (HDOD) protein
MTIPPGGDRVLFVDDNQRVLDGLRRSVRTQDVAWTAAFSDSGRDALDQLALAPFDVVVADMRMPLMDGAELLAAVAETHPRAIRLVLSGQMDKRAAERAAAVAHGFLSKPVSGNALCETIDRLLAMRSRLPNDALRDVANAVSALPSPPAACAAILSVTADPRVPIATVVGAIERDIAFTAKLLQLSNSAFFGNRRSLTTVEGAIGHLGLATVRAIALTDGVVASIAANGTAVGDAIDEIERHSLLVARVARRIVPRPIMAEDAFTAGLLHDIGKLLLMTQLSERYERVLDEARGRGCPLHVVEAETGATHADVGGYLLGLWGLPDMIVDAVARHHTPLANASEIDLVTVVHAADALVHENATLSAGWLPATFDIRHVTATGAEQRLPEWRQAMQQVLADSTAVA